jgi:nitrile hydratase
MSEPHADASAARAVRELEQALETAGIVDAGEIDAAVDRVLDVAGSRPLGAGVVARAWTDPSFAARVLDDGNAAIADLGITMAHGAEEPRLRVIANTPALHNLVVCTLCSCYPIALLGPSPAWYKSVAYRARAVREPRQVLHEFGLDLAPAVRLRVWDSTAETRYLVVPSRPPGTDDLAEDDLAALVTRRGMIGTAAV